MFNKKFNKGFTLIELLVVVGIIGIIASIILVPLSAARAKSKDARIISDVQQLRTQIESDAFGSNYANSFYPLPSPSLSFSNHVSFLPPNNSSSTWNALVNDAYMSTNLANASPTSTMTTASSAGVPDQDSVLFIYNNGSLSSSAGTWNSAPTAYAIWGRLSTGNFFCIDSTGNTKNPSTKSANDLYLAGFNSNFYYCQ